MRRTISKVDGSNGDVVADEGFDLGVGFEHLRLHLFQRHVLQRRRLGGEEAEIARAGMGQRVAAGLVAVDHGATPRIGQVSIPSVGDLVLVQFVGGDINAPIIVGSLYNDEDRPPINANGQSILHLPLGAGDSDAVHIEVNSDGKREIKIKLGSGLEINLRDDDPAVKIAVGSSATIQIDNDGAIKLESQGKIAITGNEVNIEAKAQLKLKGATIDLN